MLPLCITVNTNIVLSLEFWQSHSLQHLSCFGFLSGDDGASSFIRLEFCTVGMNFSKQMIKWVTLPRARGTSSLVPSATSPTCTLWYAKTETVAAGEFRTVIGEETLFMQQPVFTVWMNLSSSALPLASIMKLSLCSVVGTVSKFFFKGSPCGCCVCIWWNHICTVPHLRLCHWLCLMFFDLEESRSSNGSFWLWLCWSYSEAIVKVGS